MGVFELVVSGFLPRRNPWPPVLFYAPLYMTVTAASCLVNASLVFTVIQELPPNPLGSLPHPSPPLDLRNFGFPHASAPILIWCSDLGNPLLDPIQWLELVRWIYRKEEEVKKKIQQLLKVFWLGAVFNPAIPLEWVDFGTRASSFGGGSGIGAIRMKIETGVREEKRRKGREKAENGEKMVRKKICRRPRCRVEAANTAIQRLFMACKEVFKGPGTIPAPPDVHRLQFLLDGMKAEDVGLSSDLLFFKANSAVEGRPRITCTTIYQCANFSMCIFFLPPTAVIPLHNHPGMTVFCKLLLGSMHIKSYDWVDPSTSDGRKPSSPLKLARLVADSDFSAPCRTSILYPTSGGNIHTFAAITSCAVLDILGPPYSKDDGRDCTYYRDHPWSSSSSNAVEPQAGESGDRYGYLEEVDVPKDLKMNAVEYLGPQIIDG